ncbi:7601_t:CDS:2, partial [Gigaspora margarita]
TNMGRKRKTTVSKHQSIKHILPSIELSEEQTNISDSSSIPTPQTCLDKTHLDETHLDETYLDETHLDNDNNNLLDLEEYYLGDNENNDNISEN